MIAAEYHFPRGFLWGTATAAHQVEGQNQNNTWAEWEALGHTQGVSGRACDWWAGRWKEDLDRAAEGGQNAHRFSVEWSRIQPTPDKWDEDALDQYRRMARGMVERGLTPLVTLHHFTDPLWFAEAGGWETADAPQRFARFTRKVVEALREYVTYWVTINEPNVYAALGYASGEFPPGLRDPRRAQRVLTGLLRGHAAAYQAIHEVQPEARVGYAWHYRPMQAANPRNPLDRLARRVQYNAFNMGFPTAIVTGVLRSPLGRVRLPEAKGTQDFFGLNYYSTDVICFNPRLGRHLFAERVHPPGSDLSPSGMIANRPEGLFRSLKWAAQFGKPILVTENGVEDADDALRRRYLAQHLRAMWQAINFNLPVKGYFHWTLVDNFEWERGWSQRFGLWALDVETQKRSKRPSADFYAEICRANALTSDMVQRYCPEASAAVFPAGDLPPRA